MKKEEISISGMSCGHCIMAVTRELQKLPDVAIIQVQTGKAIVAYDESKVTRTKIEQAIQAAGYQPA